MCEHSLVVALLMSTLALVMLMSTKPHKRVEDTLIAGGCQLSLVLCFIGAGYIRLFSEFSLYLPEATERVMGFPDKSVIALPLIFVTIGMLLMMIFIAIALLWREAQQPSLRLHETCMPPELTLKAQQRWHLFLSQ